MSAWIVFLVLLSCVVPTIGIPTLVALLALRGLFPG